MLTRFTIVMVLLCGAVAVAREVSGVPGGADRTEMEALAKEFGPGSSLRVTPHFLIVYDTNDAWAQSRGRLFEMAWSAFFHDMTAAGFHPAPPDRRLVCVLLSRYQDYLDYARRHHTAHVAGTGGYYNWATNRVIVFDNRTSPAMAPIVQKIQQLQAALAQFDEAIDRAGRAGDATLRDHLRTRRALVVQDLTQLQSRYAGAAGLTDIAQTFHEATHQLAFNTGVQSRRGGYPFWLTEGLATTFETINPALPTGPGADNPRRRRRLTEAFHAHRLVPLADFIGLIQLPDNTTDQQRGDAYAQAWGLFDFLFRTRPDGLRRLFKTLATAENPLDAAALRRAFERDIEPLHGLDQGWVAYLAALK